MKPTKEKRQTMRVDNQTHWRTLDLKAVIVRVAREFHPDRRPKSIYISYSVAEAHRTKGTWAERSVRAKFTSVLKLYVPKKDVLPVQFAMAVYEIIEFGRTVRIGEADIRVAVTRAQRFAWAEALPIRRKPAKAKPTRDQKRDKQRSAVLAGIKRWSTKQKLANTKLRKLRTKLRRLDRELAKSAAKAAGN